MRSKNGKKLRLKSVWKIRLTLFAYFTIFTIVMFEFFIRLGSF